MIYLRLFYEFFKAGLFAVGGGMATLPFLYDISDSTGWFTHSQLADMVAVSESTPGPIGVNMATYVGFTTAGIPGAIIATLGLVTPSIIIILLIAMVFTDIQDNPTVEKVFKGMRPAVVALIAAPLIRMGKSAGITVKTFWIPVAAALLVWLAGVSPVYIIIGAIILGIAWNLIKEKREFKR